MVWSVQTGVEMERLGIPSVVVVTDAFADMGQKTARSLGLTGVPMVAAPHPFDCLDRNQVRQKAEQLYTEIKAILTGDSGALESIYSSKIWPSAQEAVTSCRISHHK